MKKIIICHFLTISLTVLTLFCFGQNKKKLRQYYYWINQAELAICDSDYYKASDCYEKAFEYHRPFIIHTNFAFLLNTKYIFNEERALRYFHTLIQTGTKLEWYEEDSTLYAPLWSQMKMMADTTKKLYLTDLHNIFEEINNSDQKVRKQIYDNDDTAYKIIRYTDSVNLSKIKSLYQSYPEVSDYTVGQTPFLHSFHIHASYQFLFDPKDILYKHVLKGNIEASRYIMIEDLCRAEIINSYKGEYCKTIYGTNLSYAFIIDSVGFILEPENLKEVNANRKKICLSETWNDYAKKLAYRYLNESDFKFYNTHYPFYMPEDAKRKAAETIELIDKGIIKGQYYIIPEKLRR